MLTPLEIENVVFSRRLTGYDPREVDEFLDRVVAAYEALYRENLLLKEKIEALNDRVGEFERLQESIQESVRAAEKAAAEAREQARARAALIVEAAEAEARDVMAAARVKAEQTERQFEHLKRQERVFRLRARELVRVFEDLIDEEAALPETMAPEAAAASEKAAGEEEQKAQQEQEQEEEEVKGA